MTPTKSVPTLAQYRPVHLNDMLRVGRENDGGYVIPQRALSQSSALLSLGVNDDWSFEAGVLHHNAGVRVTCVDGTTGLPRVIKKAAQKLVDMVGYLFSLQFRKLARNARYLSRPFGFRRFFSRHELLKRMVGTRDDAATVTLASLLQRVRQARGSSSGAEWIILKIDIEGAEYDVLPPPEGELGDVSALLVEFHDLHRKWERFEQVVQRLLGTFYLVHVHGNNFQPCIDGTDIPQALEITFLNRSLVEETPPASRLPFPRDGLDMPNNWQRPDHILRFD
jgi:hypothetical protein